MLMNYFGNQNFQHITNTKFKADFTFHEKRKKKRIMA